MARIRTLKPDFCNSPSTARLSRDARLFFVQLLTDVDDEGRCPWSAKRLAGTLYPSDEDVDGALVTEWVQECEQAGMVQRYVVDGYPVLAVINFVKHQRVSHPSPSRLPPPPDEPNNDGACEDFANDSREAPEDFANDSRSAPESFRPDLGSGSRKGKGKTLAPADADAGRRRDAVWDTVMAVCAIDTEHIPKSTRGAYNRAVSELKAVGASPDDIRQRAAMYRRKWSNASLTPSALSRRWPELASANGKPATSNHCPDCGELLGSFHTPESCAVGARREADIAAELRLA